MAQKLQDLRHEVEEVMEEARKDPEITEINLAWLELDLPEDMAHLKGKSRQELKLAKV